MKVVLCIFGVLTAAIAFPKEEPEVALLKQKLAEYNACKEKCSEEDRKGKWICYGDGSKGVYTRCEFNCYNKAMEDGKLREMECKAGSMPYCQEFECTPEEKILKRGEHYCSKDVSSDYAKMRFPTICRLKCDPDGKYKKDIVYERC